MSIVAILNATQTIVSGISGVTKAPQIADYVASLNSTDCPYAFSWPLQGDWTEGAIGLYQETETIVITVLIAPVGQGTYGQQVVAAATLLDAFRAAFLDLDNQDLNNTVEQINTATHSGLRTTKYAGNDYYSFSVTLVVKRKEVP